MNKYDKIHAPQKIVLIESFNIYYKDTTDNLRVFNFNDKFARNLSKEDLKLINKKFNKAAIVADGLYWSGKNDIDEVFLGKDTIWEYSHNATFDETMFVLKELKEKKKLKVKIFQKLINNII